MNERDKQLITAPTQAQQKRAADFLSMCLSWLVYDTLGRDVYTALTDNRDRHESDWRSRMPLHTRQEAP